MFIRFASLRIDRDSGRELGVFHTAYRLKRSGLLDEFEYEQLDALMEDFEINLDIPSCYVDRSLRRSRKYAAICWFKPQSRRFTRGLWTLVDFLKRQGIAMRQWRTELPGRVLYEDEHQVAAVPFRRAREFTNWV